MDNPKTLCPYCKEPQELGAAVCTNCGTMFPWVARDEKLREGLELLRDQIKEREISRIRATATLVEEAFGAARGGPPISLAAVKGFVIAWILPRTLIVIGSILGGMIVAAQTYIIWSQTKLLKQQADAARVEEATNIRQRLAARLKVTADLGGYGESLWNSLSEVYAPDRNAIPSLSPERLTSTANSELPPQTGMRLSASELASRELSMVLRRMD